MGASWASKMEPSWPKWPGKTLGQPLVDALKLKVFQKRRLGGLRARFWRPRASILEGLGSIFPRFSAKKTINVKNLPRKDIDHRFARPPRVGGRRWSPPGGFQSAAHRRCAKRARSPAPSLSDTLDPSQLANLKGQAHYAGLGS